MEREPNMNDDFDIDDVMGAGFFSDFLKSIGKSTDKTYQKQGVFGKLLMKGMGKVFGGLGKGMMDAQRMKREKMERKYGRGMYGGDMMGGGEFLRGATYDASAMRGRGMTYGGAMVYGGNIGEKTEVIDFAKRPQVSGETPKYHSVNTYQNKSQMRPANKSINF